MPPSQRAESRIQSDLIADHHVADQATLARLAGWR
jgi:hypothetical protein